MNKVRSARLPRIAGVLILLLVASPALAITGEDVLGKMNDTESFAYLAGSISMAAMIAGAEGHTERRDCIMNWFYNEDGSKQLIAALTRYKDREAQPVIYALVRHACGT